jgi:CRP-like cAMP-binding protein
MSMPPSPSPPANRLLARLPGTEYESLLPRLQTVALKFKQVLYEARSRIDYTYFPIRGIVSVIIRMKNGSAIEVATVGSEGVVGLSAFPGPETSSYQMIVQVAGDALRIKAEALEVAADAEGPLRRLLRRYQRAFLAEVSQAVACNGLHSVQQRCRRWLLETQDRVQANVFPLTHEFLAIMLGVRRASVSEVLDPLQTQGLIGSRRGKFTINDRGRLEAACCESSWAVNAEFDRLLA